MAFNTYNITASGNSFVNTGHTYQSGSTTHEKLLNRLLPDSQLNKSFGIYWDHDQARQRRLEGTGAWLHDDAIFKSWLVEPNSFLWLRGIAGSGKTVLSSTIIDYLRASPDGSNSTAGYYFNAREDEKRNISRLVRSLLLQLCPAEGSLPPQVEQLWHGSVLEEISDGRLLEPLRYLINREGQTYIIIDALDECDKSRQISKKAEDEKLAEFIHWLTTNMSSDLHILVTSRDGALGNILNKELNDTVSQGWASGSYRRMRDFGVGEMKIKVNEDINQFVHSELKLWDKREDRRWLPLDSSEHELIAEHIKNRASGMFRLAACLLDLLYRKDDWGAVKGALDDLPSELTKVYDRIFEDIKAQGRFETANILLRWLLYSERSVYLGELTELVMMDPEGDTFDIGRRAKNQSYVSLTLSSFVVISEDNLVQVAHQTVREYLLLKTAEQGFSPRGIDCQIFLAKCCLSYMQFCGKCISTSGSGRQFPRDYALLEYSFNNWYLHVVHALNDITGIYSIWESKRPPTREDPIEGNHTCHSGLQKPAESISEWAVSVKAWLRHIDRLECGQHHNTLETHRREVLKQNLGTLITFGNEAYEKFAKLLPVMTVADTYEDFNETMIPTSYQIMVRFTLRHGIGSIDYFMAWWSYLTRDCHTLPHETQEAFIQVLLGYGLDISKIEFHKHTAIEIVVKWLCDYWDRPVSPRFRSKIGT